MSTIQINGIQTQAPEGAVAFKYSDPTEMARWVFDAEEAREIEKEDPSLIVWVSVDAAAVAAAEAAGAAW